MSIERHARRCNASAINTARELTARDQVFTTRGPVSLQFETASFAATLHKLELSSNGRVRELSEPSSTKTSKDLAIIRDPGMSFARFVETKFIPERVEQKTLAGQTHYRSMLKHLLMPETVNRMFNPSGIVNGRLKRVPGWPYLDEVRLCDITTADHVRPLIAAASACGYSSQTVKHIKNVLYAIISHAQRNGYFAGPNPVSKVELPPVTLKVRHNVTMSQTTAILELMQYPDREIAL